MRHDFDFTREGLASCKVCGGAEGTLTTDCCGFRLNSYIQGACYHGGLDYKDGVWTVKEPKND